MKKNYSIPTTTSMTCLAGQTILSGSGTSVSGGGLTGGSSGGSQGGARAPQRGVPAF